MLLVCLSDKPSRINKSARCFNLHQQSSNCSIHQSIIREMRFQLNFLLALTVAVLNSCRANQPGYGGDSYATPDYDVASLNIFIPLSLPYLI